MRKISGVYTIKNIINGQCYIGSSVNIYQRRAAHLSMLRKNVHYNPHLQNAYNASGESALLWTTLEKCLPADLVHAEQAWIDKIHPEYNICLVAYSRLGQHASVGTRMKLRTAARARPRTKQQRMAYGIATKDRHDLDCQLYFDEEGHIDNIDFLWYTVRDL